MAKPLTVVIVTFGGYENLAGCLASLASQSFTDFDIIIVSNAPGRGVQDVITRSGLASKIRLVENMVNQGYGAACNVGARMANSRFLVFSNDDMYYDREWLADLHRSLCSNENTILQSMIFHEHIQQSRRGNPCDVYGAAGITFYRDCGTGEFYASGASVAMSKRVFVLLRGFDQKLFMYHEDVDLSWRARMMGLRISSVPSALCLHRGGVSSKAMPAPVKFYLTQRNRIRVLLKCYALRRLFVRLLLACCLILGGAFFLGFKTGCPDYLIQGAKAFLWNVRIFRNSIRERYSVQRARTVNDSTLEAAMNKYPMDLCVLGRYIRSYRIRGLRG